MYTKIRTLYNQVGKYIFSKILTKKYLQFIEALKYINPKVYSGQNNINYGNQLIFNNLNSGRPAAIGKLGSGELAGIRKYLEFKDSPKLEKLTEGNRADLYNNAGLFPNDMDTYARFCNLMIHTVLPEFNILSVWFNYGEHKIIKKYSPKSNHISLYALESYLCEEEFRWTKYLKDKKVLVLSPFEKSIRFQYKRRNEIWPEHINVLPEFELLTIKTPFQASIQKPLFKNWFDALDDLKNKMSTLDFDVALIGAGAYSLPLVSHAKALGKQAIHLGGALQIFFGIYGNRWIENQQIMKYINGTWTRPFPEETPERINIVENGCYW